LLSLVSIALMPRLTTQKEDYIKRGIAELPNET
jgi:hypothetical protein